MTNDSEQHGGATGRNSALCVTCGEFKPAFKFEEGDCTCHDCYDEGRGGVNYDLNDDGEVVER